MKNCLIAHRGFILWSDFFFWYSKYNVGDLLTIAQTIGGGLGFLFTILAAKKSRAAAERAEIAVEEVKDEIRRLETIVSFSDVINLLQELKVAHREERWDVVLTKYDKVRMIVVTIRSSGYFLTDEQRSRLNSAYQTIKELEDRVEKLFKKSPDRLDPSKFNKKISANIDDLSEIFAVLKNTNNGAFDG